jgi:hypothetical protein
MKFSERKKYQLYTSWYLSYKLKRKIILKENPTTSKKDDLRALLRKCGSHGQAF